MRRNNWLIYICATLFLFFIGFVLLHFYHTRSLVPRMSNRTSQVFTQDMLYQGLQGFLLVDDMIISYHDDPWIFVSLDHFLAGNRLMIDISRLNVSGTIGQIFFAREGGYFSEANSRVFILRNGVNIVRLPYSEYAFLRLDLTNEPNISMVVNEVIFSNHAVLPSFFFPVLCSMFLLIAVVLYLVFFNVNIFVTINRVIECNKSLVIYLLFCFFVYSLWAILTPIEGGPDEFMRFEIVNYMVEYGRLPRGDSPEIRNPLWGLSYAFTPFIPQIFSAVLYRFSLLFSVNWHISLYMARLPSILLSVGTVFFTFKIGKSMFSIQAAWFLTILMSMWPQFALISSYINNDSFGVFAISMILYSWIIGVNKNWDMKTCVFLGIAVGLCFISYYNAFTFILLSAPLWLWTVFTKKENRDAYKSFIRKIVVMIVVVFVVAGWFYIRNAVIYNGDFLGLRTSSEVSERYAIEWLKPSNRMTHANLELSPLHMLRHTNWVVSSFRSFIAGFGYMNIFPNIGVYIFYSLLMMLGIAGVILTIYRVIVRKVKFMGLPRIPFYLCCALSIPITIGLSIYFSFAVDFQPQGRYLLPMLLPVCIFITGGLISIKDIINKRFNPPIQSALWLTKGVIIFANALSIVSLIEFFYLL